MEKAILKVDETIEEKLRNAKKEIDEKIDILEKENNKSLFRLEIMTALSAAKIEDKIFLLEDILKNKKYKDKSSKILLCNSLANLYIKTNKIDAAIKILKDAIKIDSTDEKVYINLGDIFLINKIIILMQ